MIRRLAVVLLLSSLALPLRAEEKEPFKVMHAAELSASLKSDAKPTVCDANSKGMRKSAGVIPGAVLLSSMKFDAAKELPADKSKALVFYCANTMCTASHDAAKRAIKAGYSDVSVMVDGIEGWKSAGLPVASASKKKS